MTNTEETTTMPRRSWRIALTNGIVVSGMLLGCTNWTAAQSQPIADDTLGNERSVVVPLGSNAPGDRIEGGARRGDNLFHSFQQFNVDTGRGVYFDDPGVSNIITRVTGGTSSQIDGVLGVLGNANLYLINPSGIIFGANARLDVGGSFTATTADAIEFNNQGNFSATNPTAPPLLTVQPSAFLFNQINPTPIANNSIAVVEDNPSGLFRFGLQVLEKEDLTLLGGNISMDGGGVNALGGRVEIGGLSAPGTIALNADGSLSFPTGVARADVSLTNLSLIDVAADGGGSITINAGDFEISYSALSAGIGDNSGSVGAQAGDITLNASTIRGGESAIIRNRVGVGSIGNAGNISITTGSLSLTNNTRLITSALGQGNAGNVIINARDRVALDSSYISSNIGTINSDASAVGKGSDISITTGSLFLNDAGLSTSTLGQGNAGNVIINARDHVAMDSSYIFSFVDGIGIFNSANANIVVGNGGDISITTGSFSMTNGAGLQTGTYGQGNAGDVSINARDRVSLDGLSSILSSVGADGIARGVGDGGDISITTGSFSMTNSAVLAADTLGQGNAGNVIINAQERVIVDESYIVSSVGSVNYPDAIAVGKGGDIRITTSSFSMTNGADLRAGTYGQGNAGNVSINARDRVSIDGGRQEGTLKYPSEISTTTVAGAQGVGGNVRIAANSVRLVGWAFISTATSNRFSGGTVTLNADTFEATGGGQVITSTSSSGQAGNITVNARDRITLSGSIPSNSPINDQKASGLYASTDRNSSGSGGTVQITTGKLEVFDRATIAVNSQGEGVAGNINITAAKVQLNNSSRLSAETTTVNGGNITLSDVELLQLRNGSLISTTAGTDKAGGNGGNINIDSDLIVAFPNENSDIRANAFTGSGGNVRIDTQGLFGIAFQAQDNPLTSDITASSEQGLQGNVNITLPEIDPRSGLTQLPEEVVDVSDRIAQGCRGNGVRQDRGEFIVKGRGGLPPSPTDSLIGDESLVSWLTLEQTSGQATSPNALPAPESKTAAAPIVEAQGWIIDDKGKVHLIATAPTSAAQVSVICQR